MEMAYDTQTASVNRFAANQSVSASVQGLVDIIVVTSLKVYILLLCLASILKAKYVAFMICGSCVQNLERIPLSHIILCHMCVIQSSTTQATLLPPSEPQRLHSSSRETHDGGGTSFLSR